MCLCVCVFVSHYAHLTHPWTIKGYLLRYGITFQVCAMKVRRKGFEIRKPHSQVSIFPWLVNSGLKTFPLPLELMLIFVVVWEGNLSNDVISLMALSDHFIYCSFLFSSLLKGNPCSRWKIQMPQWNPQMTHRCHSDIHSFIYLLSSWENVPLLGLFFWLTLYLQNLLNFVWWWDFPPSPDVGYVCQYVKMLTFLLLLFCGENVLLFAETIKKFWFE